MIIDKKTVISVVVSVIIVLCVLVGVHFRLPNAENSYDILVFGDSNIGNFRYEVGPCGLLAKKSGMSVMNAAVGGTSINNTPTEDCPGNPWSYYSMVELSKAIANNDLTAQIAEVPDYYIDYYGGNFDYLPGMLKLLSETDFKAVKYVFVCHGLNDYLSGAKIDNKDDPYDTQAFGGALRVSIENLQKAMPQAQIILVGAPYNTVLGDSETTSTGHGCLPDYLDVEENIADEYGLQYVAVNGPINKDNIMEYTYDGMHYNPEGGELFAQLLWDSIAQ